MIHKKIAIFNACYADNVGDGIVAETTEFLITQMLADPNISLTSFDLSGREQAGMAGNTSSQNQQYLKKLIYGILAHLPSFMRNGLKFLLTKWHFQKNFLQKWDKIVQESSLIIIGGGHLISDVEVFFPIRIYFLMQLIKKHQKPVAIFAVGLSNPTTWSWLGKKLFSACFKNNPLLQTICVRDQKSADYWHKAFGTDAHIVPDPGNFTASLYENIRPSSPKEEHERQKIGIGLISPAMIHKHKLGSDHTVFITPENYLALADCLYQAGYQPCFFTNGEAIDNLLWTRLKEHANANYHFIPPPKNAKGLVQIIQSLDGFVAHRMHACIVGVSCGKNVFGFAWDEKIQSYFESIHAPERLYKDFDIATIVQNFQKLSAVQLTYLLENYQHFQQTLKRLV